MFILKILSKIKRILLRILDLTLYRLLGYYPAVVQGQKLKLNTQNIDFWRLCSKGYWEPKSYKILDEHLKPDSVYIDLGAWIGPLTLYAAKKCKKVISFEPDLVAFKSLSENILLNNLTNVSCFNVAMSNESKIVNLSSFGGQMGDTMTSILDKQVSGNSFESLVLDWKFFEQMYSFNKVDFLKIDIEGAEFYLIHSLEDFLRKYKPVLWLSLHAPYFKDVNQRAELLKGIYNVLVNCYEKCYNEKFELVEMKEIYGEKAQNKAVEFLFK